MNFSGLFTFRRLMCLLVRQNFSPKCEIAINKQINMELKACHEYLAMAYHFDRSNVALPGVYAFFKKASDEERTHAEILMQYMNKRGGQIILEAIPEPKYSFESTLDAVLKAVEMEKEVNLSLLEVHTVASEERDPNMTSFIESNFLDEQVEAIKQLCSYARQIERCNEELGSYLFDLNIGKDSLHKN